VGGDTRTGGDAARVATSARDSYGRPGGVNTGTCDTMHGDEGGRARPAMDVAKVKVKLGDTSLTVAFVAVSTVAESPIEGIAGKALAEHQGRGRPRRYCPGINASRSGRTTWGSHNHAATQPRSQQDQSVATYQDTTSKRDIDIHAADLPMRVRGTVLRADPPPRLARSWSPDA
jgi:hypothetical protein